MRKFAQLASFFISFCIANAEQVRTDLEDPASRALIVSKSVSFKELEWSDRKEEIVSEL